MRRTDHDGQATRQGLPPFRVLAVPDVAYLSPLPPATTPPPPSRAPDPYKVAPSSTSFSRAHRRSSFVILAESRPASPESGEGSPTLPTGRVSPFRGRGFKGPPPRSMSRPQSPEVASDSTRRRGRVERRVSVSQQNSPRRSLIPQPTYRQRSTSLTKANDHSPSPKIGRRFDSKTRLNVANSRDRLNVANSRDRLNVANSRDRLSDTKSTRLNDSRTRLNKFDSRSRTNLGEPRTRFISNSTSNLSNSTTTSTTTTRRQTMKISTRLSPIQGTPTKPERTTSQSTRGDRVRDSSRTSPAKTSRVSPQKINASGRRDNQNRNSTNKEQTGSPSKIPLKNNRTGSYASSTNAGRFISMPERNTEKSKRTNKADRSTKEGKNEQQMNYPVQNGGSSELNMMEVEVDDSSSGMVEEVDLINILKTSPRAIATSSERLVNTTTTTAVKPLHIDANALLVERSDGSSGSQSKDHRLEMSKSPTSTASKDESPLAVPTMQNTASSQKSSPLMENQPVKNQVSEKRDPPVDAENTGSCSKSNSGGGQTAKNSSRVNGEGSAHQRSRNQSSANQRSGRNSSGSRATSKPSNGKTMEENLEMIPAASTEMKSGSASRETVASERMPTVMENESKVAKATEEVEMKTAATTAIANSTAASTAMANNKTTGNMVKSNNDTANTAGGAVNTSVNSGKTRTRNENRGSDASLKSSTGVSTDSIESVRSTDTGVSVNTVRGVSSPREKTGMHVVKREEIETLSGNIVRVEQNGEPAVLASSSEKQHDSEKLLARWGRSLSRYCKCCSSMRCLACRRDPKGLLWTRNQGRMTMINDTPSPVAATAQNAQPTTTNESCWSKLKTRCRCARLQEIKCCARKSRVAPAESTPCCPPERRFGALCRRAFSCCNCKRADKQRTRNVRAKQSLTSVAPPPLSEEPKAKIPDVLVEHNSVMRGAIPCLPIPLAWFCLMWNVLLPGTGTVWSGLFNLCTGQPRFAPVAGLKSRLGALIVNLVVGVGQLFTVLFCLVGWGWSIWWGVTMVRLARKYKRFKASEAVSNDLEARAGEAAALPPGVPSQALRGVERAR